MSTSLRSLSHSLCLSPCLSLCFSIRNASDWIFWLLLLGLCLAVFGALVLLSWYLEYQPHGAFVEDVCYHVHEADGLKWLGVGLFCTGLLCLFVALLLFFFYSYIKRHGKYIALERKQTRKHEDNSVVKSKSTEDADGNTHYEYSRDVNSKSSWSWQVILYHLAVRPPRCDPHCFVPSLPYSVSLCLPRSVSQSLSASLCPPLPTSCVSLCLPVTLTRSVSHLLMEGGQPNQRMGVRGLVRQPRPR